MKKTLDMRKANSRLVTILHTTSTLGRDFMWTTDPIAESKMGSLGVPFTLTKGILLSEIDVIRSRRNNARLNDQYKEDLVMEYGTAMSSGDIFPAPILRRQVHGSFKFYVLSGNHRIGSALLLDETKIDAYIAESTDEMALEMICRASNRWMGDRQTRDEALEHARALMTKYNRTATDMAKLFGLKLTWLTSALKADQVRDALERLGVDSREMPRSTILELARSDHNDRVLAKAGRLTQRFNLSAKRVKQIIDDTQRCRTEQDQIDILKRFEDQLREEAEPPSVTHTNGTSPVLTRRPDRARLFQYVAQLLNFLETGNNGKPFESLEQIGVTDLHDRADIRAKFKQCRTKLEALFVQQERVTKGAKS